MKRKVVILDPECDKCGTLRKFFGENEYYCSTCNTKGVSKEFELEYPY